MSTFKGVCVLLMLMSMLMATANATLPDSQYYVLHGCLKGYCWSACTNPFAIGPWCYTTKGNRYSGEWVTCEDDFDCKYEWSCGGACTGIH